VGPLFWWTELCKLQAMLIYYFSLRFGGSREG